MKCFSLITEYVTYEYDTQIVPLLRRMCNLEELTLHIPIFNRSTFVDGTQLEEEIVIHMPRLRTFIFYISTDTHVDPSIPCLSNDDIQRTFINGACQQVGCIVDYFTDVQAISHVFSLPFAFNRLNVIGNNLPHIIFNNVTFLWICDTVPFKQEFFVRIARSFPLLKSLCFTNFKSQLSDSNELESANNGSYSVVEYPHMTTLDIMYAHIDYVEQLLHESKTHLPRLVELKIKYDRLRTVTENFTRDATRVNCIKIKRLIIEETVVHPKDFYLYFPLLSL